MPATIGHGCEGCGHTLWYNGCSMKIDHANKTISFRQSWLDTYMRCPEEGRLNMVKGWDQTSDEAFIGTATHAGIETMINGGTSVDGRNAVIAEYENNPEAKEIVFTKRSSIAECVDLSVKCFEAFAKEVLPTLPAGRAEVPYKVFLFDYNGWSIYLEGTIDFVPDVGNYLKDWKTAGSKYQQKKKQKWAVQPTAYGTAAVLGALGREFTFPIDFFFNVAIKTQKPYIQEIHVQRDAAHMRWMMHRIKTIVDLYVAAGVDISWPQVDEDNYLCSDRWCAYYSVCRGAFIDQEHDLFGYVPK